MGRYADLVRLLVRDGRSDLVRQAGLDPGFADEADDEADRVAARVEGAELAADLERMGPTFIKLGQLLSTRADILPPPYLDSLARLQDSLEPFPFETVRDTIEDELGVRLSRVFDEFDETPLAAASLGQVHGATLRGGRAVVVKVQRPGIRRQVFDDLEVLGNVAERVESHTEQGRLFAVTDLLE